MEGAVKKLIFMLLIFGVLQIGFEVFRFYKIQLSFQYDMQEIVNDSMELAMLDQYRQDKISVIDEAMCISIFINLLKEKFDLDENLYPLGSSYIEGRINITDIYTVQGKYHLNGSGAVAMDVYPTFHVAGFINIKPLILGIDKTYKIPFKTFCTNLRYDN